MSKFSLSAILSLTDNLTKPYKNTTRKVTAMNRTLGKSFTRLNRGINKTAKFLAKGLAIGAGIGLAAIGTGLVIATREFINLDNSITKAGAKFKDLNTTSADYQDRLKELSAAARDVGSDTEFMASEAAGALDKFALAGFKSAQAMALLRGTTNLATAADADLITAVDIATDSLGAFNLMVDDTIQLEKNLNRVSDVMVKTTTTANTNLEELFESVKKGGPAFTAAGQDIETFSALAGIMANAGVKGAEAGTNLRNVMLRLAKPTGEAADVLAQLGIQTQDEAGNFRDIVDIIADFEKGLKGMGTAQRTAALTTVFGARAVTGMNILLAEGSDNLRTYRDTLLESGGAAQTMAEAMRQSIGNRLKVLKSSLMELGLQFIDAFQKKGRDLLDQLIDKIQEFDMDRIIIPVRDAAKLFKRFANFIKDNIGLIKQLSIIFLALVVTIKAIAIAVKIYTAVQWLLNIAMSANPIGIIIIAIAALIAGIVLLILNWDKVVAFLKNVWNKVVNFVVGGLKKLWNKFMELLDNPFFVAIGLLFAPWLTIPALIIKHWEPIKEFFTNLWLNVIKPLIAGVANIGGKIGKLFGGGDRETRRERREEGTRSETVRTEVQQIKTETQRRSEERDQRHDIFLHGPAGAGISGTPGGFPQQAVQLGRQ